MSYFIEHNNNFLLNICFHLFFFFVGVLLWITAYVIIGDSAAPGGQLFGLVVLTVAANFGGWLISLTTLPRLIGMLMVGILFQVKME